MAVGVGEGANSANISCAANVESFLAASSHCICAQSIFSTLAGIREHPGVLGFFFLFCQTFGEHVQLLTLGSFGSRESK